MKRLFFSKLHVLQTLSCLCAPSFQRHMFISRHILVCRRCYSHECIGIQTFLRSSSCSHAFMCSVQDEGRCPRCFGKFRASCKHAVRSKVTTRPHIASESRARALKPSHGENTEKGPACFSQITAEQGDAEDGKEATQMHQAPW